MKKSSNPPVTPVKPHKETWLGRFLIDLCHVDPMEVFVVLAVSALVTMFLYGGANFLLADDKVDYCTMESKLNYTTTGLEQTWFVTGHADWRRANLIAATPSIEMAFALMQSPACKE